MDSMNLPSPSELWLFGGSLLGLWLVPGALGRRAWLFPAAFLALGIFLLAAPLVWHPVSNVWVWFLLSQAGWILLVPDLLSRGTVARVLDGISLRVLIAWSLFQIMFLRHVLGAVSGSLPAEFALETAAGGLLTVAGAALLWLAYRPERLWFRLLALFWNTHAFMSALALSIRLMRAHPGMGQFGQPAGDLHFHFGAWPGSLETFFWIPLAIALHLALFYKLLARTGVAVSPSPDPRKS